MTPTNQHHEVLDWDQPHGISSRASAASCISKGYWPQNTTNMTKDEKGSIYANLIGNVKNGWWSVNVIHYKLDVRFLRMRAAYFLIVLLSSDSGLMGFSSKPPPHQTSVARKVLGGYNIKTTRFGQWYLISIWPLIDICTCYKTQWKQSWVLRVPYTNVILKVGYIDGLVECPLGTALQPKLEGTRKLLGPNQDCSSIAWSSENTEQGKEQGKVIYTWFFRFYRYNL